MSEERTAREVVEGITMGFEVIDPEIVVDFWAFQSALTPDAPERFDGPEGWQ
ncbi:MAG TPA: hypothetical protein VIL93_06665 [Solirubrobacterales bacterium]|jgi:hypothetical protein